MRIIAPKLIFIEIIALDIIEKKLINSNKKKILYKASDEVALDGKNDVA